MTRDQEPADLYFEGRSAMKAGDLEVAIDKFIHSIKLSPHFKTLELLGKCLLLRNALPEAVIYLAAAAGLGKNQFRARFLLAQALLKIGENAKAIEKLREAVVLNPKYRAASDLLKTLLPIDEEFQPQ
jgi:tetratricopeptide (TPR) repeat protein